MFRKHSKCIYTTFKLIQMKVEDNQRLWQIQKHAISQTAYTRAGVDFLAVCETAYKVCWG